MQENLEDIFINKISTIGIDVDKIENQWQNDEDSSNLSKNKEFIDSNDLSSIESIANIALWEQNKKISDLIKSKISSLSLDSKEDLNEIALIATEALSYVLSK